MQLCVLLDQKISFNNKIKIYHDSEQEAPFKIRNY